MDARNVHFQKAVLHQVQLLYCEWCTFIGDIPTVINIIYSQSLKATLIELSLIGIIVIFTTLNNIVGLNSQVSVCNFGVILFLGRGWYHCDNFSNSRQYVMRYYNEYSPK